MRCDTAGVDWIGCEVLGWHRSAWPRSTWLGPSGQAWRSKARRGKVKTGRHGSATLLTVRQSKAGMAQHGFAGLSIAGKARRAWKGVTWHGWLGSASLGQASYGWHGTGGKVWRGSAGMVTHRVVRTGAQRQARLGTDPKGWRGRLGWHSTAGPERSERRGTAGISFAWCCRYGTAGRRSASLAWIVKARPQQATQATHDRASNVVTSAG